MKVLLWENCFSVTFSFGLYKDKNSSQVKVIFITRMRGPRYKLGRVSFFFFFFFFFFRHGSRKL